MTNIAVAYLRDFGGEQDYIKLQLDKCRAVAMKLDIKIIDIYIDCDDTCEKMLIDSECKKYQYLIVARIDFLTKSTGTFYDVVERLLNNKIKLVDSTEKVSNFLLETSLLWHRCNQNMFHENETEGLQHSDDSWPEYN